VKDTASLKRGEKVLPRKRKGKEKKSKARRERKWKEK